jgi:FkbM family methyltransferase
LLEAERDVLKLSKALVKEDSVIIDVGAYRGGYTVRFAKKAIKGKVIAIEPNSENYKFLLLNIYYNNVKNVIVYKTIAYSHRAKIKFFENKDVPAMSRVVTDNSNSIEIEAITLDEISKSIKLKKIGLIKIDAESSEYEILKGSEYTLKLTKYLIIEVSTDLKQIFDFLEERDEFKILFVGYNFIDKGGLMAIKTFRKVRERIKSAKLIIVSKRNPPEINCESIEFLGSLENKILREKVMPSCDIFLAPFLGKPSAASLLEAMAAGLPVIATFIPLYLDYVIDGKTGYLVKEYNEETFTKIIIDLIENKRALNGMQENCIKHIKNNYDPAIISKKLYDLYKRLC